MCACASVEAAAAAWGHLLDCGDHRGNELEEEDEVAAGESAQQVGGRRGVARKAAEAGGW